MAAISTREAVTESDARDEQLAIQTAGTKRNGQCAFATGRL
jgi:hypothetical protein